MRKRGETGANRERLPNSPFVQGTEEAVRKGTDGSG